MAVPSSQVGTSGLLGSTNGRGVGYDASEPDKQVSSEIPTADCSPDDGVTEAELGASKVGPGEGQRCNGRFVRVSIHLYAR
jgi:hypothetical protein